MLEILHYKIFSGHWNDSNLYNLITEFFGKYCNLVNFIFNWKRDWISWVALPLFWLYNVVIIPSSCNVFRYIFFMCITSRDVRNLNYAHLHLTFSTIFCFIFHAQMWLTWWKFKENMLCSLPVQYSWWTIFAYFGRQFDFSPYSYIFLWEYGYVEANWA